MVGLLHRRDRTRCLLRKIKQAGSPAVGAQTDLNGAGGSFFLKASMKVSVPAADPKWHRTWPRRPLNGICPYFKDRCFVATSRPRRPLSDEVAQAAQRYHPRMRSVYIETTIPSFYFDDRQTPEAMAWRQATRVWWDRFRQDFRLVTSSFVIDELEGAPNPKRDLALTLMTGVESLTLPDGLADVIATYTDHQLVPKDATGDAAHLAMASLHNIDFLLTWNIRHLANANKFQHLRVINGRLGLSVPTITTPLMLMPEDAP
jgi:hypothetical protein